VALDAIFVSQRRSMVSSTVAAAVRVSVVATHRRLVPPKNPKNEAAASLRGSPSGGACEAASRGPSSFLEFRQGRAIAKPRPEAASSRSEPKAVPDGSRLITIAGELAPRTKPAHT
jgi:hypothetical protein